MAHEWVKSRLENWARWCAQSEVGALGYPRQSTFARLSAPSGRNESAVPVQSIEASETDDVVKSLQLTQSHLYKVLVLTYAKGLPRHRVAREMHRAESTISKNLVDAYVVVDRILGEKAAVRDRARAEKISCAS